MEVASSKPIRTRTTPLPVLYAMLQMPSWSLLTIDKGRKTNFPRLATMPSPRTPGPSPKPRKSTATPKRSPLPEKVRAEVWQRRSPSKRATKGLRRSSTNFRSPLVDSNMGKGSRCVRGFRAPEIVWISPDERVKGVLEHLGPGERGWDKSFVFPRKKPMVGVKRRRVRRSPLSAVFRTTPALQTRPCRRCRDRSRERLRSSSQTEPINERPVRSLV